MSSQVGAPGGVGAREHQRWWSGASGLRSLDLTTISVARAWQTNVALLGLGFLLLLLSRHLVSEYDHFTIGFSGTSGWSCIVYLAAAVIVMTQPVDRYTFPIILAVAIACRLATLYADPFLSSDVYRYVWDGVVQHAGINPYRYVPGDAHLAFLRDDNADVYNGINRRDYAHTIYPPFAQVLFFCITFISPTLTFMKTAMMLCEGLMGVGLLALFRHMGIRRERILLYAWAPILVWEIAGSGHIDGAVMALIALALLFRYREQPVLTGVFLALAVLTKLYPLVLFPALYLRYPIDRRTGLRSRSLDWKMPGTMAVLISAGYAAYSSVGKGVFGFLGGYVEEEGISNGRRYFLFDLAHRMPGLHELPMATFYVLVVVVFGAITAWAWYRASPPREETGRGEPAAFLTPAFALAAALMFLFSPHYAWYIVWLLPFFALQPNLPILAYVFGFFYLYTTWHGTPGEPMFEGNEILYAGVLVAAVVQLILRRWPIHRRLLCQGA